MWCTWSLLLSVPHTGTTEFPSVFFLEIPGMQKWMYAITEEFLGEAMKTQLIGAMAQAGREEKQNVIDEEDYHQGVPAISVVADGDGQRGATNIPIAPRVLWQ